MHTTDVSIKRFTILAAICAGPRSPTAIRELVNWATTPVDFFNTQETLVRLGLITKHPAGGRVLLQITDAGRQVFRESADLYLSLIELANTSPDTDEQPGPATPPPSKKRNRRLPTSQQFHALREAAHPHELLTWDVLRSNLLSLDVWFGLDVADVDLQASRITIRREGRRPEHVTIDAPTKHALAAAIAGRTAGPALRRHDGSRWHRYAWHRDWAKWRTRAGVPACIVCRPRPTRVGTITISQEMIGGRPGRAKRGTAARIDVSP